MSVQTRYTDTYERGFPGQIFNASSIDGNAVFSAYANTDVFVGRAVTYVSATEQQNYAEGRAVAGVDGVAAAADIAGIITTDVTALVTQNNEAYVPAKRMCTFARANRHALIYVEADPAVAVIAPGDDVWVVVADVNTPNLKIGQFTNTAGAGAAVGMLQLPWKFFKGNDAGKTAVIDLTNV